jgi:hypothetical protein
MRRLLMALVWSSVVLVVLRLNCFASLSTFDAARSSAQANETTDEGKAFDDAVGAQFAERHSSTMGRCTKGVEGPGLAPFDLLMKLGGEGKVQEALVRPGTPVATCLRAAVANDTYTKPPRPGYWVRIGMSVIP